MAYLASLTRLRQNVVAEASRMCAAADPAIRSTSLSILLEHLDADLREVRADVETLIEHEGQGW